MRHPIDATTADTPEMLTHKLVSLAKSAIMPIYADKHLGGNALTLLFALNRTLPGTDWSGLALDYADLAGANLDGMSFRGSMRLSPRRRCWSLPIRRIRWRI